MDTRLSDIVKKFEADIHEKLLTEQQELDSKEQELKANQQKLDLAKDDLESAKKEIESREKDMELREKEMELRAKEIESREEDMELREKDMGLREKEMELRAKKMESRKRELEKELETTKQDLESKQYELETKEKELELKEDELETTQQELRSKKDETDQLKRMIEEKNEGDSECGSLKKEVRLLKDENHALRGKIRTQSLVDAENLLHKSETNRIELKPEFVKSMDEIKRLDGDAIRTMLSPTGNQKFMDAIKLTMDFDFDINKTLLEHEKNEFKLNKELVDKLQQELENWRNLRIQIKEFKTNLEKQAEKRMIKVNQYDSRSKDNLEFQCFYGDGDIYGYLDQFKEYLRLQRVPLDEGGSILKTHLKGDALKLVESRFEHVVNPQFDEISEVLIGFYGSKKSILKDLEARHINLGSLVDSGQYLKLSKEELKEEMNRVLGHRKLFQQVKKLREEEDNNLIKEWKVHWETCITKYKYTIIEILPADDCKRLSRKKEENDIMQEIESILDERKQYITGIIHDIGIGLREEQEEITEDKEQEIIRNTLQDSSYGKLAPPSQHITPVSLNSQQNKIVKTNVNCELCDHLECLYGIKPKSKEHGMKKSIGGKNIVLTYSCPHIKDLNMSEREEFLVKNNFCRNCLLEGTGQNHFEEDCKHSWKYKLKCKEADCFKKYLICSKHKNLNEKKIKTAKEDLRVAGIHYNIQ